MHKIGCIGSRETPDSILSFMEDLGTYLAKRGFIIASGNAPGADQAYLRGVNKVEPRLGHLYLPWRSFELHAINPGNTLIWNHPSWWYDEAKKYHPVWDDLNPSVRKLHARNIGIGHKTARIVFWAPRINGKVSGGTGQAVRYAEANNIPLVDLSDDKKLSEMKRLVYGN